MAGDSRHKQDHVIGGGAKRAIAHAIEEAGRAAAAAAAQLAGAGEASAATAPQAS